MRTSFKDILIGCAIGLLLIVASMAVEKKNKEDRFIRNQELAEMIATACGCKRS